MRYALRTDPVLEQIPGIDGQHSLSREFSTPVSPRSLEAG